MGETHRICCVASLIRTLPSVSESHRINQFHTGSQTTAYRRSLPVPTSQFALDHRSLFEAGNVDDLAERIDWWYEHATARHQMARVYAESANQYRLKNSIRKAEQMFAEEIAETLG